LKNKTESIRKIVGYLNNVEADGGFWLPNIQRHFVWSEEQTCRLFDSILREYPISTLLIWKTKSSIRHRKFIENWKSTLKVGDFYVTENEDRKCLVLDGQQRLQSLFIGLRGSYEGRELYFDILSGEISAPDDIKYKFEFLNPDATSFPQVKFKELIFTTKKHHVILAEMKAAAGRELTDSEKDKIGDHLDLIDQTFKMDEAITYQELDSIDNPDLYNENDVVEVFIRANSGGTKLGKSDLLFSLLTAAWDFAEDEMADLLDSLNQHGFKFDRDFVLKTCLVLLGHGARYDVKKFRKLGVREDIEAKWSDISEAIQDVLDFVRGHTVIQSDKALPSYLVLIPLVFFRYQYPDAWKHAVGMEEYILRCSLTGAFSGQPDNLIDALVKKLDELKEFDLEEVFGVIRSQGRSLELTEDRFWQMGYASDTIHLLFNLMYSFNYTPSSGGNMPEVDHIFPTSELCKVKVANPKTGHANLLKYHEAERNQLANCELLTQADNGFGGKCGKLPAEWLADKDEAYLKRHLIPANPDLWKLDRYEDFIEERKKLLRENFKFLLVQPIATSIVFQQTT
jgi:uncharacterized protein with ParB-like and HNH nuclease domain